jgi:hypothetical protein
MVKEKGRGNHIRHVIIAIGLITRRISAGRQVVIRRVRARINRRLKNKNKSANIVKNDDADELFAFSCTSDFNALATELKINKSTHDTILDSGASRHFCPDRSRFQSYQTIDCDIKTADVQTLKTIGTGNCQGTPVVVPTRANIRASALNKGGSGDPGARSIVGRARVRTSSIRYIY